MSVRSVSIAWRPFAELRLEGVALAPARGSAGPAPVTAGAVRVHLDGLEALRSRGRHIVVDEVAVERPSVALRLLPGGHHDLEDVVAALRAHPLERSSREVHVRRVSVSGGALRVSDEVDAGRAPALLALANLQSRIDEPAARRVTVPVAASLEVWGATPTQEGSVAVRVTVDQTQREVALDGLALRLGSTEIDGSVDVAGLPEQPRLRALALTSRGATLDALLPLFPGVHPPSGSLLRGPVSLRATAAGDAVQGLDVDMSVDAAGATVIVPEWLHKPAGTPFAAAFRGRLRADDVAIARAGVTVGPLSVNLHGDVRWTRCSGSFRPFAGRFPRARRCTAWPAPEGRCAPTATSTRCVRTPPCKAPTCTSETPSSPGPRRSPSAGWPGDARCTFTEASTRRQRG